MFNLADSFANQYARACERKGGEAAIERVLGSSPSQETLRSLPDDRALALMAKRLFCAGFHWGVIEKKWPGFETVFHGFAPPALLALNAGQVEAMAADARIVRNPTKVRAVIDNAHFVASVAAEHGSFGAMLAAHSPADLIGLWELLKKRGSRLGGNTGQYLLRGLGVDSFILSRDVVTGLRELGLELADQPTSKTQHKQIQACFNQLHRDTGRCYTHLSKILAYANGENYPLETITTETQKHERAPV